MINEVLAKNIGIDLTTVLGSNIPKATPEYIELYNPTATALDLEDMSLSDNIALPRKYTFGGKIIASHSSVLIMADSDAPASANNTGFGIKANGDIIYLFDKPNNGGSLLDSISYGVQARDFSIGRVPDGGSNWVLNLPTPRGNNIAVTQFGDPMQLTVNEWMADPAPGDDDWFEIYNPNPQPVEVSGFYLTDEPGTPAGRTKFQIAPRSFIGTGLYGYERFIADNIVTAGPDHTNFKLSGSGEAIGLYRDVNTEIDTIVFGPQIEGASEGRLPDGSTNWVRFYTTATPADANYLPLTTVVINEVLSHSNTNTLEDAIELYNASAEPVDISGWYLSDQQRELKKYRIPDGPALPAGGYAVFYENQFNSGVDATSFALDSAKGDQVYLATATMNGDLTGYRASVDFGAAERDVSFGRYTNSVTNVQFVAMSWRTFGQDNPESLTEFRLGTGLPNAMPKVGPVVINEIMYHPPDLAGVDNVRDEFIELYNFTGADVPLYDPDYPTNTWRLRGAVRFDFPINVIIPPGEYVLVVSFDPVNDTNSLAEFRARYPIADNLPLYGPYSGKLDNGGESVKLERPDNPEPPGDPDAGYVPYILVDRVAYSDSYPWDSFADGSGASLQRRDPAEFGNDPANWFAASPTPGPQGILDSDGDGMPDAWELEHGLKPYFNDALEDEDGDGLSNRDEYLAGTLPDDNTSSLRLEVTYSNPLELSFAAAEDRAYIVEYRDGLGGGDWTALQVITPQSTAHDVQITDDPQNSMRFYRVRMVIIP